MLEKTRGIVLHSTKYGDNSLIVTMYTKKFGRQSYMVNATHGRRSANKASAMQPLFLLETESYQKKTRELQRLKESSIWHPYVSLPYDIHKSTQAIFLTEILCKILQEEEPNPDLYDFLENALLFFDTMEEGVALFHMWFLVHLSAWLGIYPLTRHSPDKGWFDMKKGVVVDREPLHSSFMDQETTHLLITLQSLQVMDLFRVKTTRNQRNILLNKLMEYYSLHFGNLNPLKSLQILKEVFDG
ncbi:MAG TPA: DNA repair protein RecO [Prolixibacteraceae bacterium]|nr:DNA repair protein RecO [Prolixibacteraceae bacterium]HQE51600.1 DNA repair protein RecO [Prolixibacteraceae bacterium]HQH75966.1 DNA repair protein RecO [Prolixibacteraceae bacterium]